MSMKVEIGGDEEVSELEVLMSSLEQLKARDVFASVQQVVPELKKASELGLLYYAKQPEPLPKVGREYEYRHEPVDLLRAMYRIYARGGKAAPPDMSARVPQRIVYSVRDKSLQILNRLRRSDVSLQELYRECASRSEIVATFVSVLELCSIGSVHIERTEDSYSLSFIGGNVDEIMEKIVE
jgi:segregation and condensation protein A